MWDAEDSIYHGLRALPWRRYLCAMWIAGGELRAQYLDRLDDSERSLMTASLDAVRAVVIAGEVTADQAAVATRLSQRWEAMLDDDEVLSGQWNTRAVFANLTAELAGTGAKYEATERLHNAAEGRWREPPPGSRPRYRVLATDEEVDDASPMARTLSRLERIVTGVARMPEPGDGWDPAAVQAQLFGLTRRRAGRAYMWS